jgi:threonine dehydrogenase-like Zn-dependent dehydrogenase
MDTDRIEFEASDYNADGRFTASRYAFSGSPDVGWQIERNGEAYLDLGPGYRALRTIACGVCSTDLDRHFLPFPLPQVTGHELVGVDSQGQRYVVEINASCLARGLESPCAFCRAGFDHHCPERLVLGIHDLPGGFGAWHLAPIAAALPVPDRLPTETAVLIEPFAAALHAVATIAPRPGDRIAVLGPRRLGMLVVAALAGWREKSGIQFEIVALARRPELCALARTLGADETCLVAPEGEGLPLPFADVVVDTTGSPDGLRLAARLARREVHLKSTHGQPAQGLVHLTEMVVDEISLRRCPVDLAHSPSAGRLIWLAETAPPVGLESRFEVERCANVGEAFARFGEQPDATGLPGARVVVVDRAEAIDVVLRPDPQQERSLVRPLGEIWIDGPIDSQGSELLNAIVTRDLKLSTSRCGDFKQALALLCDSEALRDLGARFITDRFPATELARAFEVAASPGCIKTLIQHPEPCD